MRGAAVACVITALGLSWTLTGAAVSAQPAWQSASIRSGTQVGQAALVPRGSSLHTAWVGRPGGGAWYARCDATCLDPAAWRPTELVPTTQRVHEIALALDPDGVPRVLAWTDQGVTLHTCGGWTCTDAARWQRTLVSLPGAVPPERRRLSLAVAADRSSHIAVVAADGSAHYVRCPSLCTPQSVLRTSVAPSLRGTRGRVVGASVAMEGNSPRLALVVAGLSHLDQLHIMSCPGDCTKGGWTGSAIRADFSLIADPHLVTVGGAHRLVFAFEHGVGYVGCEHACTFPSSWKAALRIADTRWAGLRPQLAVTPTGTLHVVSSSYSWATGHAASLMACHTRCHEGEYWGTQVLRTGGHQQLLRPAISTQGQQLRLLASTPSGHLVFARCDAACGST